MCWNGFTDVIQALFLAVQTVKPVPMSPADGYVYYAGLASDCLRCHEYKLATICADKALNTRVLGVFDNNLSFAYSLIAIGKYQLAKDLLLKSAASQKNCDDHTVTPIAAARQQLLGQAYMGLQQYESAAEELSTDVPVLPVNYALKPYLKVRLFVADLCLGNDKAAIKVLDHWRESRHVRERLFCPIAESNPILILFGPFITLSSNDFIQAHKIATRHIELWEKCQSFEDPEAVPMLNAASQIMLRRGYAFESSRLSACADRIKMMRACRSVF